MRTMADILEGRIQQCEEQKELALRKSRFYQSKFDSIVRKITVRMNRLENRKGDILVVREQSTYKALQEIKSLLVGAEKDDENFWTPVSSDSLSPSKTPRPKLIWDFSFSVTGIGEKSADYIADKFVKAVEKKKGHAYGGYHRAEYSAEERGQK